MLPHLPLHVLLHAPATRPTHKQKHLAQASRTQETDTSQRPHHYQRHTAHSCFAERASSEELEEMAAAGNSRFAVTCGLLRQYMRDHQQQPPQQLMGGLAGALGRLPSIAPEASTEETDARTMELFPTRAAGASSLPSQERMEEQGKKAPLTILYKGRMVVFDDFPAETAEKLIQLAGSGSSPAPRNGGPPAVREEPAGEKPAQVPSDMPIARKASVKRFLEKRKHRITAADPYCHNSTALEKDGAGGGETTAKDEPAASWLTL